MDTATTITIDRAKAPGLKDCAIGDTLTVTGIVSSIDPDKIVISMEDAWYNFIAKPHECYPELRARYVEGKWDVKQKT